MRKSWTCNREKEAMRVDIRGIKGSRDTHTASRCQASRVLDGNPDPGLCEDD